MNPQPLVSVIIPTYNRAVYLKRAVESVLAQSYKNIELLIINDGSSDKTPAVISELKERDPRIVGLTNKGNLGIAKSSNRGIRRARGKYIARLDDDDFWADPKKIEKQVEFLEAHPDYVLVGGGMIKIDREGREIKRYLFPEKDEEIRRSLLVYNLFVQSTILFRKEAWQRVGGYDETLDFLGEDRDLWLKLGRVGKFYNFQEFFTYYLDERKHNLARKRHLRRVWTLIKVREKYRGDYPGFWKAALFCWANYLHSFLPFGEDLRPLFFVLRKILFGPPPYFLIKSDRKPLSPRQQSLDLPGIGKARGEQGFSSPKENQCLICGSTKVGWFSSKDNFELYQCKSCDLIYLYPQPALRHLINDYYSPVSGYQARAARDLRQIRYQKKFRQLLDRLADFKEGGNLLDVGCANGEFLFLARARGFRPYGVEVNKRTARIARNNGLEVFPGTLKEAKFNDDFFAVVNLGDVIEHVPDPLDLLRESKRVLQKGGVVVVTTPNLDCFWARATHWLARSFNFPWSLLTPPHHLFYFSDLNLGRLLVKTNFKILRTEYYRCSLRSELAHTRLWQKLRQEKSRKLFFYTSLVFTCYLFVYLLDLLITPFKKKDLRMVVFGQNL